MPQVAVSAATTPPCLFFSSRRRHTRSLRDWSSDVCSSDLILPGNGDGTFAAPSNFSLGDPSKLSDRSEERRVGKESRYRWAPYRLRKKEAGIRVIVPAQNNTPLIKSSKSTSTPKPPS